MEITLEAYLVQIIITIDPDFVLSWNRPQQAAFLILIWSSLVGNIKNTDNAWTKLLREPNGQQGLSNIVEDDHAFSSKYSLLSTDQGVRGVLHIYNDLCYMHANDLELLDKYEWKDELKEDSIDLKDVEKAYEDFIGTELDNFVNSISKSLLDFYWVTSSTPGLDQEIKEIQGLYRGSSGYKEIRKRLLLELQKSESEDVKNSATKVLTILKY